jgi:tetratricopeptide (TPR) repeat protein
LGVITVADGHTRRGLTGLRTAGRGLLWLLVAVAALLGSRSYAAGCTLGRLAELPVTMNGLRPMINAKINGENALFIVDSGAFYSFLSPAAAAQFKLRLEPAPPEFEASDGSKERVWLTRVKTFTIFDIPQTNLEFLVFGSGLERDAAGILGQNIFRIADVEYDLANGAIRLMRPHDCKNTTLAYWAAAESKPYSAVDIEFATVLEPYTRSVAYVNGSKIRIMFDTGAATSVLTPGAAKRAAISVTGPGVIASGSWYIGKRLVQTWIAPVSSFKIGDEEIRNTRLRIGETGRDVDMLIGADFFLSHRIYVASSQRKLYFTYNGGPVFNLRQASATAQNAQGSESAEPAEQLGDQPTDASGFARRGAASVARRDYNHALADFTRACELAPTEASYFYERGRVHWQIKEPALARADFDQAIKLKPEDVPSLIARAGLRAGLHEPVADVDADLEAADRAAPQEALVRLEIGHVYEYMGQFPEAVNQYSKWIASHGRDDGRMSEALNSRCWARALWGQELQQALGDCDGALKLRPDSPAYLDSRGLVYLRQNNYDKAVADYDASLRLRPHGVWSLYGRGLARLHKGQASEGNADILAAKALRPEIAAQAGKYGLSP